jgi:hypothetical protein
MQNYTGFLEMEEHYQQRYEELDFDITVQHFLRWSGCPFDKPTQVIIKCKPPANPRARIRYDLPVYSGGFELESLNNTITAIMNIFDRTKAFR